MKKIEAIIRKSKFDEVVNALHDAEVYFFSYWDVTGVGNEKIGNVYRGITYSTKDIQRRCLSIIVSDSYSLPVFGSFILNPEAEAAFLVFGVSF